MSILDEIKSGESKKIEFKSIMPSSDKIMKTAIGFSNCAGGKLIIGVEDNGNIIGISDEDVFELPDKMSNIIYDGCYPIILPEIYTETIDGKIVLVVEIYPGNLKPYYIKSKKKSQGTYVRVGTTNKLADENMILELERQKRNISFDEEICYELDYTSDELRKLLLDFSRLAHKNITDNDLINFKLLKEENGNLMPTNALGFLIGNSKVFEYARIRCARFKGINTNEFIDSKDFEGPLYEQVEGVMKFVKMYIEKYSTITELQRKDSYIIPLVAIREALVNAVVHRDYSILGADIKVAIFDDRIEIISPGSLPKTLGIEDIKLGRSEVRNKIIARFFKEIGFIEQWGTGIRRIISICSDENLEAPSFMELGNGFKVTLYKNINKVESIYKVNKQNSNEYIKDYRDSDKLMEGDDKSQEGDDKSQEGDDKSQEGDDKSREGDDKSREGDDKSREGDDKSREGDDKSREGDDKSQECDDKSQEDFERLLGNKNENSISLNKEDIILNYLKLNDKVSTIIASELIGLKTTATKNLLKKMVTKGLLKSVGNGKARFYIVNNDKY